MSTWFIERVLPALVLALLFSGLGYLGGATVAIRDSVISNFFPSGVTILVNTKDGCPTGFEDQGELFIYGRKADEDLINVSARDQFAGIAREDPYSGNWVIINPRACLKE